MSDIESNEEYNETKGPIKSKKNNKEEGKNILYPKKPEVREEKKRGVARKWYILLVVIGVITLVSYFNCLNNQFVFDDIHLIVENPTIRGIEKIPSLLGIGKRRISYRPVRMISYAVDYTLNKKLWRYLGYAGDDKGLNPLGYHISNLVYHMLTSFLVFLVIYRLVANYRVAFLAASLFALHPVHTDSVTYLAGRRDILFTLFYLAGFYFFLCYRRTRRVTFIIASFLAYLLSLGSKEMAVTFPAIILCYDLVENFTPLERRNCHLWWGEKSYKSGQGLKLSPNFLTGFTEKVKKINFTYFKEFFHIIKKIFVQSKYLYSLLFIGALPYIYYKVFIKSPSHQNFHYGDSILTTFLTVGKILVYYMKLLVYPITLNADYSFNAFPLSSSFFEPATFLSFILLGVVGYVVSRLLIHHKMLAFGAIWFFASLLPVCQIFPHHELLAEHYLYLPSFGFCLMSGILVNGFLKEGRYRYFIYLSFMAVVFLFLLRIVDRNRDWRDELTLWEKTVKIVPQCVRAHNNLGVAYFKSEKVDEGISECKRALAIKPNYAEAHYNLGVDYLKRGKVDEAIAEYKQALAIKPNYAEAHHKLGVAYFKRERVDEAILEYRQTLAIKPNYAEAHNNLGAAYIKKGRLYRAIYEYKRALMLKPLYADAHYNLGIAFVKKGRVDEAISEYKRALAIKPNYAEAHYNLGVAYFKRGKVDEAILEYKQTLAIKSNYAEAHYNLGVAYARRGKLDEAISEYKQALAIKPQDVKVHTNLGVAYHEKGELDRAISAYKRALSFNPNYAGAHNNLAMAYFKEKQYALAVKHCDRALELGYKVNPRLLKDLLPYRKKGSFKK